MISTQIINYFIWENWKVNVWNALKISLDLAEAWPLSSDLIGPEKESGLLVVTSKVTNICLSCSLASMIGGGKNGVLGASRRY